MSLIIFRVFEFSIIVACYPASMFLSLYIFFRNVLGVICCIYHPGMGRPIHRDKFLNGHFVVVFGQSIKFFERI